MEFSSQDFVSAEEILSDVLLYVQEERYDNLNKGWFFSQIRKCLEELSYDTFFHEAQVSLDIPSTRIVQIPAGVFNIKQMSLYSGDLCNVQNTKNVYFKRNFFHMGSQGYFARNKFDNGNDVLFGDVSLSGGPIPLPEAIFSDPSDTVSPSNLYYFGEMNGSIMLSPSCSQFSKLMIRFNGIWTDEDKPTIPRFFRQVVTDWCTEKALRVKAAQDPQKWRMLWLDADKKLGYGTTNNFSGSWYKAEVRVKKMGTQKTADLKEMLTRMNY